MSTATPMGVKAQRRAYRLTPRGALLLAAGVTALVLAYILGWDELLIIGCFAAIPPLGALVYVHRLRPRLTVARTVSPSIVSSGGHAFVRLNVVNTAPRRTVPATWRELLPWQPHSTAREPLAPLAPGGQATLRYEVVPPRRGIVELGPFLVEIGDPFLLAKGEFPLGANRRIVVAPEIANLDAETVDIAADSGSARLFQHRALAGEHDLMTREYRPGDALRRVHWRASAHHGELRVREEEKRSHAQATIVLETRRDGYADVARIRSPDAAPSDAFEWALSMTASLRDHLARAGMALRVVETGRAQLADPDRRDEFLEGLARAALGFEVAGELRLGGDSSTKGEGLGSLFAVLGSPDDVTIESLARQRHFFDLAVVFLAGGNEAIAAALTRASFTVVAVAPTDAVPVAWARIGEEW